MNICIGTGELHISFLPATILQCERRLKSFLAALHEKWQHHHIRFREGCLHTLAKTISFISLGGFYSA